MSRRWVIAFGIFIVSSNPALARTEATLYLDPYSDALDVPLDDIPADVQIINSKDTEIQNNLSVGDTLLKNINGVNVNDTAGNPYQPDVTYHGFTASPVLGTPIGLSVYQDGVRVNEAFGDVVNFDLIPENAIASTTLIPGSNPLYGLNTLGGAIALQTKNGLDNPGTELETYGGSFGRRALEGETGGSNNSGLNWFFAGTDFAEDGWRDDSASDVRQGFGKIGWKDDEFDFETSLTVADNFLTGLGYSPESLLRNQGYDSIYTSPDNTDNTLVFLNTKAGYWVNDEIYLSSIIYFRSTHTNTLNGDVNQDYGQPSSNGYTYGNIIGGIDFNESANTATTTRQNGEGIVLESTFKQPFLAHKNIFITGISYDYANIGFNQTYAEGMLSAERNSEDLNPAIDQVRLNGNDGTLGIFATDDFSINYATHLTLSARFNDTNVSTDDELNPTGPDSLNGHQDFQSLNPAIGLTHDFSDYLNVYGGYNQGNRAPSSIEIGCSNPASPCALPNTLAGDPPTLKQVIADTWEGGFRGKITENSGWNFGAYRTVSDDDIQFIASNTTGAGYFTNVGETLRQGFDTGVHAKLDEFKFSLGYSFIDATFHSPFQIANDVNSSSFTNGTGTDVIQVNKGDHIPGIPQNQLKLRGEWQAEPEWVIGSDLLAFSSQYAHGDENNEDPSGRIGGYTVVDLDTRYTIANSGWQVFANVNNLFNRHYANGGLLGENNFTASGQFRADGTTTTEPFVSPGAPLAVWVGVSYKFGQNKPDVQKVLQ